MMNGVSIMFACSKLFCNERDVFVLVGMQQPIICLDYSPLDWK